MPEVFSPEAAYEESRSDFIKYLGLQCRLRIANVYEPMTPRASDSPEVQDTKMRFCLAKLEVWAGDTVQFIKDCGWAPDPKGEFGSREMPEGMAPTRMVPIVLYPEQERLVRELDAMLACPRIADLNLLKSRQVAATVFIAGWWLLHKWLFHASFAALLGSYDSDVIDPGGKGHREGDALFPRLRSFVDAFMWALPALKFNQHLKGKFTKDIENHAWMADSEDKAFKLVRPRWWLFGAERYSSARKNTIKGLLPGDTFGKGDIFTVVLLDEFGEYAKIGSGVDRKARQAVRFATNHIVTWGTIPEGGGSGSEFKALCDEGDSNPTLVNFTLHWTDILPYMLGAEFKCPSCSCLSKWGGPMKSPGPSGMARECAVCAEKVVVRRGSMTSPWYRMKCASLRNDPVAIARYLEMDWGASSGSRFFEGWRRSEGVVRFEDSPSFLSIEGFDPGQSTANPAAWVLARMDPSKMEPCLVAYWIAPGNLIEWWVPFFKRWSPSRLSRMRVPYGKQAGERWMDVFRYSAEALEMLEIACRYDPGQVYGDKFGSHRVMVASAYDVLHDYGVDVDWRYTGDREKLCRHGRDWACRMKVSEDVADIRPPSPSGAPYPGLTGIFEGAKLRPNTGQSDWKLDVDKQDPPHVSHGADAWFYLCRGLPESLHASMDAGGAMSIDLRPEPEVVIWGEGAH